MRLRILAATAVTLCALLGAVGCSKDHRIEIQSDTCWDGIVNSQQHISGCYNKNYKIIGTLGCVRLQKQTVAGYMRMRLDGGAWSETSEQFGLVQICQ
ncbi:MAG: hypothetical protein ABIU54_10275 [Candidatus Eisenbacteria bacterium]